MIALKLFCGCLFGGILIVKFSVELEAEKQSFVFDIVADKGCICDHAALDKSAESDELRKLALEIELIAFGGDEINIAPAGIDKSDKLIYINIFQ